LTKGWNGDVAPASVKSSVSLKGKRVANGEAFKAPAKPFSRTVFAPAVKKPAKTTVVTRKNPTAEETRKGMDKLMQKYNFGGRN
jgi:hypothetical protein